jgi:hypothetical protein
MSGGERGRRRRWRDAQDGTQQETRAGTELAVRSRKGAADSEMNHIARPS